MKVDKKANFCIFFLIAILALGLSNFAAAFTGEFVSASFPEINDTDKMIAIDNDNFAPTALNAVYEKKVVVEVNETDNETETNATLEGDSIDVETDTDSNSNTNENANGDRNTNSNTNDNTDTGENANSNTNTNTNTNENENSGWDGSESSLEQAYPKSEYSETDEE